MNPEKWSLQLGASPEEGGTRFRIWAPRFPRLRLKIQGRAGEVPLTPEGNGYLTTRVEGLGGGARYFYLLQEEQPRPDPVSRCQPEGVHGPSEVCDPDSFAWEDHFWKGRALEKMIFYEIHVGTFTTEGTFEAVIPLLDYLKNELGVTALELMPVAQFPGARNWGYDGTFLFAPQNSYGGPRGLKKLTDACHRKGLAVVLDVVYNHLGPEGNYLNEYGPYFTDRYKTPWGAAVNLDGPESDEVHRFIVDNALYWVTEYHLDGLRIDAVQGIFDFSARHILAELKQAVAQQAGKLGRRVAVIAERDLNDVRVINSPARGGYGLDAQWNDDFHHALHALLTRERGGYYQDFGDLAHPGRALSAGFVYSGQYSSFLYFVNHSDPGLLEAVRRGRKKEWAGFFREGEFPDPQDEKTFLQSRIQPDRHRQGRPKILFEYYQFLIGLRKKNPVLSRLIKKGLEVKAAAGKPVLIMVRRFKGEQAAGFFNFNEKAQEVRTRLERGVWWKALDSASAEWNGPGSLAPAVLPAAGAEVGFEMVPWSAVLYRNSASGPVGG